jgi:hypothetical protein
VHRVIADTAGGAWTFGGSILTFVFPMLLFVVVAIALYVVYTKPETVPGRWVHGAERSVSYTPIPGQPSAPGAEMAGPAPAGTTETTADEPAGTGAAE